MSTDLPDYTRSTAVNSTVDVDTNVDVRPKGGILEKGTGTTAAAYASLVSRTVTNLKTFQVAKVLVACTKAAWIKYQWNGTDISCARLISDDGMFIEHFPLDYYTMAGNGSKKFDVLVKYVAAAGTIEGEIVGEEVDT